MKVMAILVKKCMENLLDIAGFSGKTLLKMLTDLYGMYGLWLFSLTVLY